MSGSVVQNGRNTEKNRLALEKDLKAWNRKWGVVWRELKKTVGKMEKENIMEGVLLKEKLKLEGMLKENEKQGVSLTHKPKRQRTTKAKAGFEAKFKVKAPAKAQTQTKSEDVEVEL